MVSSSMGGVGEGKLKESSDGTFSFFFSKPLAFDNMAGMAGGSSDCAGLVISFSGSDKSLLLTCVVKDTTS